VSVESDGEPSREGGTVSPGGPADTTETVQAGEARAGNVDRRRAVAASGRRALRSTRRFIGVLIALIVMIGVFAFTQERFLTYRNFELILRTTAVLFMVSIGNTYVLLTAGFDLSVGSMLSLGGIALAMMLAGGWNEWIAILLTLALTMSLGGLVNGMLIGVGKLSFFVVTLATLSLFRGITYVWTNGMTQRVESEAVATLGDGKIAGLSVPILLMAGVLLISLFVLHFTRFGRAVYAVGGNREAARLSGINVPAVIIAVYAISGLLAGLGAVIQTGRLAAAAPVAGTGLELSAAAAVLLGGTSFSGGSGGVGGTLVGVLFIGVLRNGLGLSGVSAFWQEIVTGLILITAISIDRISQARSG
jgi:ribose/xylose/arabinose/galactoside ABC-type transport system permease subunit